MLDINSVLNRRVIISSEPVLLLGIIAALLFAFGLGVGAGVSRTVIALSSETVAAREETRALIKEMRVTKSAAEKLIGDIGNNLR